MASPTSVRMLAFTNPMWTLSLPRLRPTSPTVGAAAPTMRWADSSAKQTVVDPHCAAYRRIFDEITARMDEKLRAAPIQMSRVKRKEKPGVMTLMKKIMEQE